MIVNNEEFLLFSRYIYDLTGLVIDENKRYLLENRFEFLCQELGCDNLYDLYFRSRNSRPLENRIIDLITTHETFFFREERIFDILKHFAADREQKGNYVSPLDIWCAGCANGQEVYSAAIALSEALGPGAFRKVSILGSDISDICVAKASYGRYSELEVERGLSSQRRMKHFTEDGDMWRINDEIRVMTTFKRLNLREDFSSLRKYDVLFCRNVAIYFSHEDKKRLFDRFAEHLKSDGMLFIGSTETLIGVSSRFHRMEKYETVYYKLAL